MKLLEINSLSKDSILKIINLALKLKLNNNFLKINASVANIFIEPSTRTKISFIKAEKLLGLEIYNLDFKSSSFSKKETLKDTIYTLIQYGINNFVIRSNTLKFFKEIENIENINIINAGDGINQHPTQALIDALTIYEHFKRLDNLKIIVCGDIKFSRVFNSFYHLIKKFNSEIMVACPDQFKNNNLDIKYVDFNQGLKDADVIMMLRVQNERHLDINLNQNEYIKKYQINLEKLNKTKKNAILIHPGPINWNWEIKDDITYNNSKVKILKQVKNGIFIRAVVLGLRDI